MTESDLFFKPLVQNLRESKIDSTRIQILRAIGNLCYYNGKKYDYERISDLKMSI